MNVRTLTRFTTREINLAFKDARRVFKSPGFTILCAPAQKEYGRLLVIASRKVGTAPERNLVRRRLKAAFYEQQLFNRPYDTIVIVNKAGAHVPYQELAQMLASAVAKAMA